MTGVWISSTEAAISSIASGASCSGASSVGVCSASTIIFSAMAGGMANCAKKFANGTTSSSSTGVACVVAGVFLLKNEIGASVVTSSNDVTSVKSISIGISVVSVVVGAGVVVVSVVVVVASVVDVLALAAAALLRWTSLLRASES